MKNLFFISFVITLLGCGNTNSVKDDSENKIDNTPIDKSSKEITAETIQKKVKENSNSTNTIKELDYSKIKLIDSVLFTYFELDSFDLRDTVFETYQKNLKAFNTKDELYKYFQHKRVYGEYIYPMNIKYCSIQKANSTETILTILVSDETCCTELHYLVYNADNVLISDNVLAGIGGDGMWAYEKYGKFINDSIYRLTKVEFWEEDSDDPEKVIIHTDSIITLYRFNRNDTLKEISTQRFNKIY